MKSFFAKYPVRIGAYFRIFFYSVLELYSTVQQYPCSSTPRRRVWKDLFPLQTNVLKRRGVFNADCSHTYFYCTPELVWWGGGEITSPHFDCLIHDKQSNCIAQITTCFCFLWDLYSGPLHTTEYMWIGTHRI